MSEAKILDTAGDDAKQAMFAALDHMKGDLAQAADLRVWAKQHPWATLGVAAVAGFAAASAIIPRRGETVAERVNHLAGTFAPAGDTAEAEVNAAASARMGLGSTILSKLFDLARVAITNAILSAVQSRIAQYQAQPPAENGSPRAENVPPTSHA